MKKEEIASGNLALSLSKGTPRNDILLIGEKRWNDVDG